MTIVEAQVIGLLGGIIAIIAVELWRRRAWLKQWDKADKAWKQGKGP